MNNVSYSNFSTRRTNKWFFWNYALLSDLFNDDGFPHPGTEEWIIPVCQGFVAERLVFNFLIFNFWYFKKKKMTRNFQKINDILLCDKIDAIFELLDGNRESFISM